MVRKKWVLIIFQSFCSPFFNEIAIFSASVPHIRLQPTDRFLPLRFRRLLTIIKLQQRHEKKGEKALSVEIFQSFCSRFFQWNGYFQCQCTTHDITAHRPIFAHTAAACSPLLKSSSDVKCKVRNLWVLIIFQIFCLPFLQWNSTFSAHAPHMISQPIDQFLPCCCRCLPIKQQCKKNGEKPSCFFYRSVILLTFF